MLYFFIAYFRFTHQDVGWYYAYADRLAHTFSLNGTQLTWNFSDTNGNNSAGVIFMFVQLLAIVIAPNDLIAIKILSGIIAFSTFVCFFCLLKNRLGVSHSLLFALLLVIDPLFTFQIMNRPEMLASLLCLFIFYIGLNKNCKPSGFFIISFLTIVLLDIHPSALYVIVGFNIFLFLSNYKKIIYFVTGILAGLLLTVGLNHIINGNLGVLAFFGNNKEYLGDHYFPLFNDPLYVIVSRPFVKLKYFIVYFLFGALLIYGAVYFRRLAAIIRNNRMYTMLFLNALIFFLLSNLFSEGGNGYALYSLIVYLPVFIVLYHEILKLSAGTARKVFIVLLFTVPVFGIYKSVPRVNSWIKNNGYFWSNYYHINEHVKEGDRILIRPTFSFALSSRKVICEPTFPVMIYMYNHHLNFPATILAKGYDLIAIDEMFLNDADIKTPVDIYSNGPFHKSFQQVRFDTGIIREMEKKAALVPVWSFNDFYHGKTVFYRVNKTLLKEFCEEFPGKAKE